MFITVFTPTYNRAHTLPRLYESLKLQGDVEFEWLVVDDGSTDETAGLVEAWSLESNLTIRYIYQENGGMLSAHNCALQNIDSELLVCVDSDDYLVDGALSTILEEWQSLRQDSTVTGLVGLDVTTDGRVLGDPFPSGLDRASFKEIRFKYGVRGDKKYVFRTSAIKRAGLYPVVPGERYPAASYLYRIVDRQGRLALLNKPLCVVEYQEDGNSKQKFLQYRRSPNAFMKFREFCMADAYNVQEFLVSAVHYVSASLFARRYWNIFSNRYAWATVAVLPFGVLLNFYLRRTARTGMMR